MQKLEEQEATAAKGNEDQVPFLKADLPEDEDDDDEYDPRKDPMLEVVNFSDEDSLATASDAGSQTPRSGILESPSSLPSLRTPK